MSVAGLVLAAGAGRRFGSPKALLTRADGRRYVDHAVASLRDAGCDPVVVVGDVPAVAFVFGLWQFGNVRRVQPPGLGAGEVVVFLGCEDHGRTPDSSNARA